MNSTIKYYDDNAIDYFERTRDISMDMAYERFEQYMPKSAYILDLGCGSGRDSKYFLTKGYSVKAIDASIEMCRLASSYTGLKVENALIENIAYEGVFDGIWANASLLHIGKNEMKGILTRCIKALKKGGCLYASWKCGDNESEMEGRFFSNYSLKELQDVVNEIPFAEIKEKWMSQDLLNRGNSWINLVIESCDGE